MSRSKALAVFLLLAAAVGTALCSSSPAQNQPAGISSKLRVLLKQKRDTLKERFDALEYRHKTGSSPQDDVIAARNDWLDAELELATDKVQRLALLEQQLASAKEHENLVRERWRLGTSTVSLTDALLAKANRLEAEIALLREQESTD